MTPCIIYYTIRNMTTITDIETTDLYDKWYDRLKDQRAISRIDMRIARVAETGNFGDAHSVGFEVSEMRIDYGPGYRVYYTIMGKTVVILLAGGIKTGQQKDIQAAQAMAKELRGKK